MNAALLSSKKMDYCTPQRFFDALNQEFHFALDAAATAKSAKCQNFFTPETDGLKQSWSLGGQYSAIRLMDGKPASGFAKPMRNLNMGRPLFC